MAGIMEAAGIEGPLGRLGPLYDRADTEGALSRELVVVWCATHEPMHVADLVKLCATGDPMDWVLGADSEKSQQRHVGVKPAGHPT